MEVNGIASFRKFFGDFTDAFVLLGGVACNEWFTEAVLEFRLTRDIDMVLLLEARSEEFFIHFLEYLHRGGYSRWERADGVKTSFRFVNPVTSDFPYMIELLARPEIEFEPPPGQTIVRLSPGNGLSSLSAILLDEDYYDLIMTQRAISRSGLPLVTPPCLLLLKSKAFLNLTADKAAGKNVKGSDIKKHRNDVFRLAYLLDGTFTDPLPDAVRNDLESFLAYFPNFSSDWQGIQDALRQSRLQRRESEDLVNVIRRFYSL